MNVSRVERKPGYEGRVKPRNMKDVTFDTDLTCGSCEGRMGKWEDYAKRALYEGQGIQVLRYNEMDPKTRKRVSWESWTGLRYGVVKLFVLSVIWRLSASKAALGGDVDLGPHEERIRELLDSEDPGGEGTYNVGIHRVQLRGQPFDMVAAYRERVDGVWSVYLFAGGFLFITLVTRSPVPAYFGRVCLQSDGRVLVPILDAFDIPFVRNSWFREKGES